MQPPARSAEAWSVFSLVQAPCSREQGREAAGGEDFSLDEWYSENNER